MSKQNVDIDVKRHSYAHILAAAVLELFPKVKLGMGPTIENGFYYDFEFAKPLSETELQKIEKKMRELIVAGLTFKKTVSKIADAEKILKKEKQPYKLEILEDLKNTGEKTVSFYATGKLNDLCSGPHVANSRDLSTESFMLSSIAGAYWKGTEKNKMLTRVYGLAFNSKKDLDTEIKRIEEAKKFDHRKLGQELKIYHIDETVGKGLPLWLPRGAALRQALERFIVDEETKRGYSRTYTPVIGNVNLYKLSGHWDHYQADMYPPIKVDGEEFVLRPMTCPHQFMIYKAEPKSYRDLPVRLAELAEMYRKEKSGELTGLQRVMGFTLSDAHIICREDQLEEEFLGVLDLVKYTLKKMGLSDAVWFRASLRDKDNAKYIANDSIWEKSEKLLLKMLKDAGVKYILGEGEAAFYGPKADVQIRNINGKEETIITLQIDLNSAERFDMTYKDENGREVRPVIIHRSSIGCIERTVAFLLEHHKGALPFWMSPVQIAVVTVSEKVQKYASELTQKLKENGFRAELMAENESVGKKIREAELQKIPYMIVVGEKEIKSGKIAVRSLNSRDIKEYKFDDFIEYLTKEL